MTAERVLPRVDRAPKRHSQLPEAVAAYVRERIITGAVRPGDFLRMEQIAEAVGVSNTPVREGLLALASQGYVRQLPRRGFVVAPFAKQDILDLFWAQATLSGELAARAADRILPEQLARLDEIMLAHDRAAAAHDHAELTELGHAFHREINLAGGSIRLAMLLGSVVRNLPLDFYATITGWVEASHDEHPAIVEALRRGNASEVRSLMEHHISTGADRLIDTLEARGLWSEQPAS